MSFHKSLYFSFKGQDAALKKHAFKDFVYSVYSKMSPFMVSELNWVKYFLIMSKSVNMGNLTEPQTILRMFLYTRRKALMSN